MENDVEVIRKSELINDDQEKASRNDDQDAFQEHDDSVMMNFEESTDKEQVSTNESSEEGFDDTDDDELDSDDYNIDYDVDNDDLEGDTNEINDEQRGLVGLQNLGNTCYMNGALQALSNCQQLTRFVLDCPGFLKDKGLSHSYSELIREIWSSRKNQYAVPASIIRNIKCIYPAFRGCTQQDTQEFLRCFLEQLHDELKQPVNKRKPKGSKEGRISNTSESNKKSSNHSGEGDKVAEENVAQRSIISDTFEFKISSSVVCSSCNNISTTKETFKDLSIPIPSRDHPYYQLPVNNQQVLEMVCRNTLENKIPKKCYPTESQSSTTKVTKSHRVNQTSTTSTDNQSDQSENDTSESCKELQKSYITSMALIRWFWSWYSYISNWFWGPQVTLQDCLSIFFGTDPLEGDNEYSCEVCTKKNRGVKYLKVLELPEVLCIHFKRYESIGSAKITTHVSFPLVGLDLAPFMSEDSRPQCTTYNLIACICHHGSALLTGHYTTYALNCYDDQWYEFDDQYVTCVPNYTVENSEAYILFYQKSTLDNRIDRQRVKASQLLKKSLSQNNIKKYFISKQWVNKFNTFVEPGPITNFDILCEHKKVPRSRLKVVDELCHQISKDVWKYLKKLHGGGPECQELVVCDICEKETLES